MCTRITSRIFPKKFQSNDTAFHTTEIIPIKNITRIEEDDTSQKNISTKNKNKDNVINNREM